MGKSRVIGKSRLTTTDIYQNADVLPYFNGLPARGTLAKELEDEVEKIRQNKEWRVLDIQWMSAKHRPERSGEGLYDAGDDKEGRI